MPELPEVETIKRALAPRLRGTRFVDVQLRRTDLRFPFPKDFARRLQNRPIGVCTRRAKYLLVPLAAHPPYAADIVFIHLGMSGRLLLLPAPPSEIGAHDHVLFHCDTGSVLLYRDPRRFGYMGIVAQHALHTHPRFIQLGLEPLGRACNLGWLRAQTRSHRLSLKALLLQQSVLVGVGNIYANETLFHARLHPARLCTNLDDTQRRNLLDALKQVLRRAVAAGGSSLGKGKSNFVAASGEMGYFQMDFAVYGRAGRACVRRGCKGIIEQFAQNGRSSFACPVCQL